MDPCIEAVFLDLGNTLRILIKDPDHIHRLMQLAEELKARDQEKGRKK